MKYTEVNIFMKDQNHFNFYEDERRSIESFEIEQGFLKVTTAEELTDEHGSYFEYRTTSYAAENVSSYNCTRQVDCDEMVKSHMDVVHDWDGSQLTEKSSAEKSNIKKYKTNITMLLSWFFLIMICWIVFLLARSVW